MGLVDAQPHGSRIGDQPRLQEQLVRRFVAEFKALLLEGLNRFWILHPGFDVVGGAHGGARSQEG